MNEMQPERVRLLITIAERGYGRELTARMRKRGVGYQLRCTGRGTASTEMMDLLGLGSSEKDILISMGAESAVNEIVGEFTGNLGGGGRGKGIMMLFSPSAVSSLLAAMLTMEKPEVTQRKDAEPMKNEHQHSLILVAVNQGYTDQVMQTARRAGATGGTIVRARLADADRGELFSGITLQSEKEIVAILAPDSIRAQVMDDVNREYGLRTEAQGVLCALPVDKAFRI
ncbi:MAG: hypothetical protein ACI3XP_00715 [Eubacteriales bacterium]